MCSSGSFKQAAKPKARRSERRKSLGVETVFLGEQVHDLVSRANALRVVDINWAVGKARRL